MAIGCETVQYWGVLLHPWNTGAGAAQLHAVVFFQQSPLRRQQNRYNVSNPL